MLIKFIEKHLKFKAAQDDLRKAGLTFTTAGIIGIFLQHLVKPHMAIWLVILGLAIWLPGLIKSKQR